jgi:hypothetical protein
MRWSGVVISIAMSVVSAAEYSSVGSSCESSLPIWANAQNECMKKTLQYTKNTAPTSLLGGETRINYDLKKNTTVDTASMSALYTNDAFMAKVQGLYIKPKVENTPSIGKTNVSLLYRQKLWESLSLNAAENVTIPLKTAYDVPEPTKYTSLLKALYPLNDIYNVFAEGSYTRLDVPASESILYRNPYSYTTGITYSDNNETVINASYVSEQDADPTVGINKKIKLAHKHKINKRMKTSLSVTKSLESLQPDNNALFNFSYAF